MKTPITLGALEAEKNLLDQAVLAATMLSGSLEHGLPNREKNEARVKLREACHWLRDASLTLAEYTEQFKAKLAAAAQPLAPGVVGVDNLVAPEPISNPAGGPS